MDLQPGLRRTGWAPAHTGHVSGRDRAGLALWYALARRAGGREPRFAIHIRRSQTMTYVIAEPCVDV
ncbi:MAG TPA: hypothetical protein VIK13_15035, partial [Candidatus Limnocylindrales bacterium]